MKYFSIFVLCILIIPLFHMNTAEIAEQENRTLAKFPETKKKDKPNYEFGKEFETWLGDRFWGRDKLIDTRFQTMYKINGRIENDKAFVGDDGWMFMKDGIVNVPSLEKQRGKIEKDADILKRFDDKFKGKNIPIYLILIPDRNQLYQKYWDRYYTPKPRLDYGDELIKSLKDHPNIHIIYPKEEFMAAMKTEELFLKYDDHLSEYGMDVLLKKIKSFFGDKKNYLVKKSSFIRNTIAKILKSDLYNEVSYIVDITAENLNVLATTTQNGVEHTSLKHLSKKGDAYIYGNCYAKLLLRSYIKNKHINTFLLYQYLPDQKQARINEAEYIKTIQSGDSIFILYYNYSLLERII